MKVIETEIEGLEGVETDVGWLVRGGIAAEMNVRQAYTVKHIRKALTLWGPPFGANVEYVRLFYV